MATVRRARAADADEIAAAHVAAWETTYAGWLPEAYLRERDFPARQAFWRDVLAVADPEVAVFVACASSGAVVGFASGGPERTGLVDRPRELYALYLLEEWQGHGLGRRLVTAVLAELGPVAVWVLADNPACGFYERLGGRRLAGRRVLLSGTSFAEVAYSLGP